MFWALYALCGISDMVDGWLARNLQAESKTGAVLDSVADIVFVACCATRLLPVLEIPIAIVAAMATFAAVQEGHFIRKKQVFQLFS